MTHNLVDIPFMNAHTRKTKATNLEEYTAALGPDVPHTLAVVADAERRFRKRGLEKVDEVLAFEREKLGPKKDEGIE